MLFAEFLSIENEGKSNRNIIVDNIKIYIVAGNVIVEDKETKEVDSFLILI